jgi:hypothetical protein
MNNLIAYNTNDLDALIISEQAEIWQKKELISIDKLNEIKTHYLTHFYSPNVFMRIGGFIFCSILVFAFFGLFAIAGSSGNSFSYIALFAGIICIFALEKMIKSNHYKSGIDDALLYCGLGFIIGSLTDIFKLNPEELSFYLIFLPLLIIAAMRYLDALISVIVYGFLLAIIVLTTLKFPTIAPSVLSFVVMIFAAIMYFFTQNWQKNIDFRFWKNNLDVVEGLSLILFYASCNYFILQQANEIYFNNPIVSLAPLFWFLTFFMPLSYIYQGLKQKNRLILSVGLLGIAAGVATFRYYFHVVPIEIAAIIGGTILLGISYFSIQYLKRHKTPFTYEEDSEKPFYHHAESLIIAQSLGNSMPNEGEKMRFGGGDFGGGGAGQEF